ncbi:hypothetical protein EDM68_01560 [Candidatus Uhrbacteria bacterium]|nr:MAG: hypothetical protein EDM68_01560 [Candidatus Uhrbacteria bacterium]
MITQDRPDPKPIFTWMLEWLLEFKILTYLTFVKTITPRQVFEQIKDDAERRSRIYEACTGMAAKFAMRFDVDRQINDIDMAIETDETVARNFVDAVGVSSYVELFPLRIVLGAVTTEGWSTVDRPEHRQIAVRALFALIERDAFGPEPTPQRVLDALTIDALFGDDVPAKLRVHMAKAIDAGTRDPNHRRNVGEILFGAPKPAVSFEALAEYLDVTVLSAPFLAYTDVLGLVDKPNPAVETKSETGLPPEALDSDPPDAPATKSEDDGEPEISVSGSASVPPDAEIEDVEADDLEDVEADETAAASPPPLGKRKRERRHADQG